MIAKTYIPYQLTDFVELISEQYSTEPGTWTFLPDGISCLMFRLKASSRFDILQAKKITQSDNPTNNFCFITGFCTGPVKIAFDHFNYLAAFLKPIALKSLFGIPAHNIRDFAIEGSLVIPELDMIEDKLNELPSFIARAQWLEKWLYNRIKESVDLHTATGISRLAKNITYNHFNYKGRQLEDMMGYSRAQTHRLFNQWFGLSSQKYQRLMKFVRSMEQVHSSEVSLRSIAFEQGYFDQAHFIRTFKEFTNMTPSAYRQCKSDLFAQMSH